MANSQYEYVKAFEQLDALLPACWIVVRVDGKGFHKFCEAHAFEKPNDARALHLMDACAQAVLQAFGDIRIAFGVSDEYSFIFHKGTSLYSRRASKLTSLVVSCFTANYVRLWDQHLPTQPLLSTPMFDGRAVCYPNDKCLRDYLAWRQVDAHINNQYNTCIWALRQQGGKSNTEAQQVLKGTLADFKNEMLFSQFGINYSDLPAQFRKGSVVLRRREDVVVKHKPDGTPVVRQRSSIVVVHEDIIGDRFYQDNPSILAP